MLHLAARQLFGSSCCAPAFWPIQPADLIGSLLSPVKSLGLTSARPHQGCPPLLYPSKLELHFKQSIQFGILNLLDSIINWRFPVKFDRGGRCLFVWVSSIGSVRRDSASLRGQLHRSTGRYFSVTEFSPLA